VSLDCFASLAMTALKRKPSYERRVWLRPMGRAMDRANRRGPPTVRHMLGAMMKARHRTRSEAPSLLDVVALLTDLPTQGLARGQVGTVVELLDDKALLVEFSDDQGRAYAVAPCQGADLLVLHYVPEAA